MARNVEIKARVDDPQLYSIAHERSRTTVLSKSCRTTRSFRAPRADSSSESCPTRWAS